MNFRILPICYRRSKGTFSKSATYLTILQAVLHVKAFSTRRSEQCVEFKCLNKALRVTDLLYPKPMRNNNQEIHLQLIQDFLQAYPKHFAEEKSFSEFPVSQSQSPYNQKLSSFSMKDPILGVAQLHKQGLKIDVALLSYTLSACGYRENIHCGAQLQCLAIREGFSVNVYVGSALISMYSKCGDQHSAFKVFKEMPLRNIVSWTALISGFAQEGRVDRCLELYSRMRNSALKPNEFTLTSLLSACVGSGFLVQGRIIHCQAVLWGVDSYIHVANALISMYCKCGNVEDAFYVFGAMHDKDVVTWNSMIAGYALHGLANQAIYLFEEMRKQKIKPDCITFLGVLSSCRHAGLVNEGRFYFSTMREYGVIPDVGHYSCIVDLLGRAGLMEEARDFILAMPMQPNAVIWGSLLSSCRLHDNVWIGIEAAESRLALEPSCAATHVQLAKLYARVGLWDEVAKVWKLMKDIDVKTNPGYSWIEIGNEICRFGVNGTSSSRMSEVLSVLGVLMDHMAVSDGSTFGYVLDAFTPNSGNIDDT
ncbi:hypothetical protein Cgig2_026040 [Carnegiea gigantea]|uniref:Uncharacterized protein n=1 Tax=Carnegiea gigantea TaxID=171969 RepID=A0A9Q1KMW9_9CARY|nr:hypothetical protein Cgig2_026040 [Carnegiea gigantea]